MIRLLNSIFKLNVYCLFMAVVMLSFATCTYAEKLNLTIGNDGWTIFAPSSDTRIVYVSEDGNDDTGIVYTSSNHPNWRDPITSPGAIQPFATYAAAFANTRDGYPDWILFKRGDTFTDAVGDNVRNGRSSTEPFLIGAYGTSGLSPIILSSQAQFAIAKSNRGLQYAAFSGLNFYSYQRDPANSAYVGGEGQVGISILTGDYTTTGVLIE